MSDGIKPSLKRLERLVQIRETYVSVAEAGVKQAEGEVRSLEASDRDIVRVIQAAQADIAYLQTATGHEIQASEKYVGALEIQRRQIALSLAKATENLERRRREWTEAMREHKIMAKVQARRLHEWARAEDVEQQKSQDDSFLARYVRTRLEK
jgi:flagellar export protein FliJ